MLLSLAVSQCVLRYCVFGACVQFVCGVCYRQTGPCVQGSRQGLPRRQRVCSPRGTRSARLCLAVVVPALPGGARSQR